jgi:hypothetical protein
VHVSWVPQRRRASRHDGSDLCNVSHLLAQS